jgi:opacity protein-like surface antigen
MARIVIALMLVLWSTTVYAQRKPDPPRKPAPQRPTTPPGPQDTIGIRGFVTFGSFTARATDTFDTLFGSNAGLVFGGGGQVLFPGGWYVELSASRFRREGERVFVGANQEIFPLGIPLEVTLTPLELTGGWRYFHCPRPIKGPPRPCRPTVVPYLGGGFSSYRYQETSDFSGAGDDLDERFSGFHLLGGAEYRVTPFVAVGGELAWSTIADAIGEGGVSAAFDEDNLGGFTVRLKISIGR